VKNAFRMSIDLRTERLLKRVLKPLFKNHVYVAKQGLAKGFKIGGNLGFLHARITDRDRFLMTMNLSGKTVYDVGSHIGKLTLFFSKAVGDTGKVISFEPNPEAFEIMRKNVEMNGLTNVKLIKQGLAEKRDTVLLVYGRSDSGLGTMNPAKQERLINDNLGIKTTAALVDVCPLDELILANSLPDPDFIKIDVEGYEYNALLGMQETLYRCKPSLLVEVHRASNEQGIIEAKRKIITLLMTHDYEIRDIRQGQLIGEDNVEKVRGVRHLFCTFKGIKDR
jgi:FkbM family methyltransferase